MRFLAVFLAALLQLSVAFDDQSVYIHVPTEVTAGTPFQAKLDVEVHNGGTQWSNAFRVYLAASAINKTNPLFFHTDCYLLHEQPLCDESISVADSYVLFKNTSFTVTIPANIGPSGNHYVLKAQILQTDGSYYGTNLESSIFSLSGGTGEWADYQLQGYTLWGDDGIACAGYACARNCSAGHLQSPLIGNPANTTNQVENCINSCSSVSVDFENSTRGGQPTTDLTTPTACPVASNASPTARITGSETSPTATRTRSAAAAGGTSDASPLRTSRSLSYIGFSALAIYLSTT
ncbi:hypothetical protein BCR34DRAFT_601817 [Clohesyomyces aquaticus]|uniref:Uncharacterized protein n=1 Tax=Clohesyomyces aquaticus TaxID=1231657 RepID=A0A1Y1ZKL0_9PLEO|nr:hypothetical protein BCR34DRAFT_601817 [Clohesyomyces aquaticus]